LDTPLLTGNIFLFSLNQPLTSLYGHGKNQTARYWLTNGYPKHQSPYLWRPPFPKVSKRPDYMIVLDDSSINSFLIISGKITESKRKEFEQTFRMVSSTISMDCMMHKLTTDASKDGYYYFFSLWRDVETMKKFRESSEYFLMTGAFHALGTFGETWSGNVSDAQKLVVAS
jgi:quinol monooxygenase YgiN